MGLAIPDSRLGIGEAACGVHNAEMTVTQRNQQISLSLAIWSGRIQARLRLVAFCGPLIIIFFTGLQACGRNVIVLLSFRVAAAAHLMPQEGDNRGQHGGAHEERRREH
jgi:hypothetical protein